MLQTVCNPTVNEDAETIVKNALNSTMRRVEVDWKRETCNWKKKRTMWSKSERKILSSF